MLSFRLVLILLYFRQLAQINPRAVSCLDLNENLFIFLDNEADVDLRNELGKISHLILLILLRASHYNSH
jgi:hypothetical protein